jgi:2-oxoglutarate ferredoxin oxidoreductase subunit alpha
MKEAQIPSIVVKIAGDSGDGIQLIGSHLTKVAASSGNDLSTLPDFPAEIRAPQGTKAGVSGFQIHFGSIEIDTPGDHLDVLVALNAAAYCNHIHRLKMGGMLILDTNGFDSKNLRLSNQSENLLEEIQKLDFECHLIPITDLTKTALELVNIDAKEKDRCKNMFVLGLIFWLFEKEIDNIDHQLKEKFALHPTILEANLIALRAGYNYGDTTELFSARYSVAPAEFSEGEYRNIFGNQAMAYGLMAAGNLLGKPLFFASYPITPASDILHELVKYQGEGIQTLQAEDEIAAAMAAIGAAFGGSLGVTCTSGPGMDLKAEAIGLAVSMEVPMIIIDVQRAGPSTGMPTKTEQSDLLMAMYGRHGECPLPIIAAYSPSDCFNKAIMAAKIAFEYNTPVILLSDGFIANSAEPWKIPSLDQFNIKRSDIPLDHYFARDAHFKKPFVPFGINSASYRIGGIEKDYHSGNISYDGPNHQKMVDTRANKVLSIANLFPHIKIEFHSPDAEIALVGWGSTYGSIRSAVKQLNGSGHHITHIHFEALHPFAKDTETILRQFKKILVCELNAGQLIKLIREKYLIDAKGFNKVQGNPFLSTEIIQFVQENIH